MVDTSVGTQGQRRRNLEYSTNIEYKTSVFKQEDVEEKLAKCENIYQIYVLRITDKLLQSESHNHEKSF